METSHTRKVILAIEVSYKWVDFVNFRTFSLIFQFLFRLVSILCRKKVKKEKKRKEKKKKEREVVIENGVEWVRVRKLIGELKIWCFWVKNYLGRVVEV